MEEMDLEVAGEYLVTAAWLLAIKSRLLLPRHEGERGATRAPSWWSACWSTRR